MVEGHWGGLYRRSVNMASSCVSVGEACWPLPRLIFISIMLCLYVKCCFFVQQFTSEFMVHIKEFFFFLIKNPLLNLIIFTKLKNFFLE